MNKKILIGLVIIGCLFSWYSCSSSNSCPMYAGDGQDCDSEGAFSREKWHKYPFEASREKLDSVEQQQPDYMVTRFETRCIREAMICDLTQNIIPLGTPYEEVVSLLGNGYTRSNLPSPIDDSVYKYFYPYDEVLSELITKKKALAYTSGGSVSGDSYFLIRFENGKIIKFARAIQN